MIKRVGSGPVLDSKLARPFMHFRGFRKKAKTEILWQFTKGCGTDNELERFRSFLEYGIDQEREPGSHPLQRSPLGYYPGLTAAPWHDPEGLGWHQLLQPALAAMLRELDDVRALRAAQPLWHKEGYSSGTWSVFYLHSLGVRSRAAEQICPIMTALTASLPGASGKAFLSALQPGMEIHPHHDTTNTRLRFHLGLIAPAGCAIRVGTETKTWHTGQCLLFDGSFEHEVWHKGDSERWVLIIDAWHPDLNPAERRALHRLSYLRRRERYIRQNDLRVADVALAQLRASGHVSASV